MATPARALVQVWTGRFWIIVACAVGGGTALGLYVPLFLAAGWLSLAAALSAALWGSPLVRRCAWPLIALVVSMLRATSLQQEAPPPDLPMPRSWPPIQVVEVATEPEWTPTGHRFEVDWLQRCPPAPGFGPCQRRWGRLRVDVTGRDVHVSRGDTLRVPGFVRPPPHYGNPGSLDRRTDWLRRGLWGSISVPHPGRIAVVARSRLPWNWALTRLGKWRRDLGLDIAGQLAERDAAIVGAMALGDRASDWPELDERMRETGTAHILAVSGSHLALVIGAARWFLRAALRRWGYWALRRADLATWTLLPLLAVTWSYTALTGAAPSTVRSAWMVSAAVVAEVAGRQVPATELLALAATTIWFADPLAVDDVGLQLSIAGVAGLLWAGRAAPSGEAQWRTAVRAALGAFAATAPVTIVRLGQLAWWSVPANLLAVPYAAALLPISVFGAAAATLPTGRVSEWAIALLSALLWPARAAVAATPGLFSVAHPQGWTAWWAALSVPLWLAALWHRGRWRRWALLSTLALTGSWWLDGRAAMAERGTLRMTFLDVGHGDATLLQFDDGATWLVDGGGEQADGGRVGAVATLPALQALGVKRIDRLLLSHAHPDHENGLLAVVKAMPIGEFWWTGQPGAGPEHDALLDLLAGVPRRDPGSLGGLSVAQGSAQVRVLWPHPAPWRPGLGLNDNSLVVEVAVGPTRLLLAGDVEAPAEALLAESGALRPVSVLKVPHHGSRTSSTPALLDRVRPVLAVAGARSYGPLPFPSGDVRARYRDRGIRLWPSEAGMIEIILSSQGLEARQAERTLWAPTTPRTQVAVPPSPGSAELQRQGWMAPGHKDGAAAGEAAGGLADFDSDTGVVLAPGAGQKACAFKGDLAQDLVGWAANHEGDILAAIARVNRRIGPQFADWLGPARRAMPASPQGSRRVSTAMLAVRSATSPCDVRQARRRRGTGRRRPALGPPHRRPLPANLSPWRRARPRHSPRCCRWPALAVRGSPGLP